MSQTLISKFGLYCWACTTVILMTGCGGPKPEPTGTLLGSLKSRGEVCDNCLISIGSTETSFRRGGNVSESGTFELKGIPFGDYQVRVVQMPTNLEVKVFDERIPKKYRNLKSSGLTVSITSTDPVTLDIDME